MNHTAINIIFGDVYQELTSAISHYPPMNSAHEGIAVLAEEVDELWQHVKHKPASRDLDAMRAEAIQVAAMAIRFVLDVCGEERGRR